MSNLEKNPGTSSGLPERDDLYYLDSEPIIFQVERRLFKVPRYQFMRHSDVFNAVFSLPKMDELEGSIEEMPVKLEGISCVDFRRLLTVLYPLPVQSNPTRSEEEWVSVLKLATMWNMDAIRELAILQLSTARADPIARIVLGKAYNVPLWLRLGYLQAVLRPAPISFKEGETIGWQTAIRLCHLREDVATNPAKWVQKGHSNMIETEFEDELREVTMVYESYGDTYDTKT